MIFTNIMFPASIYLFKVSNNVWTLFKVNNKDTRPTSLTSLSSAIFKIRIKDHEKTDLFVLLQVIKAVLP